MENNRNTIVVNAEYQYRLAAFAVSIAILATNILLIAGALAPQLVGFEFIVTQKGAFVVAGIQVFLLVLVWFISIRLSHRVAGPIYAFNLALEKVERGDLTVHLALREKDEFKEIADSMNRAISATRARLVSVQKKIELVRACSDHQETQESITNLQNILGEFTFLGEELEDEGSGNEEDDAK